MTARSLNAVFFACISTCFGASHCHGQVQPWDAKPRVELDAPEPVTWTIHPAEEPVPALRYRLWPARADLVPGNAMVPVHRAMVMMLEKRAAIAAADGRSAFYENYNKWMDAPLDQLPTEEVADFLENYESILAELHRMVPMREAEYDLKVEQLRGPEAYSFLLPEIQNSRELARLLALHARLALAEGRMDDALQSLRAGIRLGDAIGASGDLLIIKLVAIATIGQMLDQVEVATQLPEVPNLYWALATVPASSYDISEAARFESAFAWRVVPELVDLPEAAEAAEWRRRLVATAADFSALGLSVSSADEQSPAAVRLLAGLAVTALAESSRHRLIESGHSFEAVGAMSPSEAVVRATSRSLQQIEDDFIKWLLLPDSLRNESDEGVRKLEHQYFEQGYPTDIAAVLHGLLLPASRAAETAERRTELIIARLATVQALRDYAAEHGELPDSLEDLQDLPPWPNPFSGESFGYTRIDATTARLTTDPTYPGDREKIIELQLVAPATSPSD